MAYEEAACAEVDASDEVEAQLRVYSGSSRRPLTLRMNSSSRADEASCSQN